MDPNEPTLSYGIARVAPGGHYHYQAVVFAASSLEVDAIPSRTRPGAR